MEGTNAIKKQRVVARFVEIQRGGVCRRQHGELVLEQVGQTGTIVAREKLECLADALLLKGVITPVQHKAGIGFRRDFWQARLQAHWVGSYSPDRAVGRGGGDVWERDEKEEAAYRRWRAAMKAMSYPWNDVVVTAICHEIVPPVRVYGALSAGLDRLVVWYEKGGGSVQKIRREY